MALQLSLLGKFEAVLDQHPVKRFRGDKVRALLAYLSIEGSQPHRREKLATLLWSEVPDKTARQSLSVAYFRLRQALDKQAGFAISEQLFSNDRKIIEAHIGELFKCDVSRFRQLIQSTEEHDHADPTACSTCLEQLTTAVSLYHGELLPGFHIEEAEPFVEWLYQTREQLHRQVMTSLDKLCDMHQAQQSWQQVQTYAQQLLAMEAWNEKGHAFLMRALAHSGQRGAALAQYDKCCQILWDELGVEPSRELTAVYEQIKSGQLTTMQAAPASVRSVPKRTLPTSNISPSLTPFFDRETERDQLRQHLLDPNHRLVTLVGEGGMGKTRLAQEMALAVQDVFPDGVWFVPLANIDPTSQPEEQIARAIADSLQLTLMGNARLQQQLTAALQNRQLLLVLDNFEHILDGADFVYTLLQHAPHITICCTTREPLGFMAETVLPLQGLPLPKLSSESDQAFDMALIPSVALFADRANRTTGQFDLTAVSPADVTYICQFVNGSPLGIELAASALRYHSLPQITTSLQSSLDFLTTRRRDLPLRHRSMRAVFAYSWDLLMSIEQKLFAHLSVFRGSFTSEAARAVAGASFFHLEGLTEKSLLKAEGNGRFAMHGLLRQFAKEKLKEQGKEAIATVRKKHSHYYLLLVAKQAQALRTDTPQTAVSLIEQDIDNVRAAWQTAVRQYDTELIDQSVAPLADFCQLRGYFREAEQAFGDTYIHFAKQPNREAMQQTLDNLALRQTQMLIRRGQYETAVGLAQTLGKTAPPHIQGDTYLLWAEALWRQGNYDQAKIKAKKALALAQEQQLSYLEATCWHHLGVIADYQGNYETAKQNLNTALSQWQVLQARQREGVTLNSLGGVAYHLQNFDEAATAFQQSIEISRQIKDRAQEAWTLNNLGVLATIQKSFADATHYLEDALALTEQTGDQGVAATVHRNLGWLNFT
ncbi:MAG: BTAD domain-containing putative transcriptional regulator, partial [Chloroflexota bacterium]